MSSIETIIAAQPKDEKPSFKELPEHQELNLDGIDSVPLPWERSNFDSFRAVEMLDKIKETGNITPPNSAH